MFDCLRVRLCLISKSFGWVRLSSITEPNRSQSDTTGVRLGLISESSTDYAPGKFSVFTVTRSKIKMPTIQYRKSRIWEMKEYKYTKSHAKNGFLFLRYFMREIFGKTFYPNLKALNGDAMCRVGVNLPRRRSSRVPAPLSGAGTHDERLRWKICWCPS